eukprot:7366619-Prymnesium_polylepis.1
MDNGDAEAGVRRIYSTLVSGYLFITHQSLAEEYAQVVKRHPPLICLDTGLIYSQGRADGDMQDRRIDFNTPNCLCSQQLLLGLQQKWRLQDLYRMTSELKNAFEVFEAKQLEHDAVFN